MMTLTKPARGAPLTLWPMELNILLQLGRWDSADHVLTDALESLLAGDPALRQAVAIELYRQESVSLGRAAEIAGTDRWSFMDALRARGIEIEVEPNTAAEIEEMLDSLNLTE